MPRLFWSEPVTPHQILVVTGEDGHHFARVLRAKVGEEATVAAAGVGYLATVVEVDASSGRLVLRVDRQLPPQEPQHKVYVVQAMAKADKVETVVQKCTEVGVAGILLYESSRCVAKVPSDKRGSKLERWQKVAREAAIQCQRDTIPVVEYAAGSEDVGRWLHSLGASVVLLLDEQESSRGLRWRLQSASPLSTVIVVGPEGGWDERDRADWQAWGALPTTLGRRILRTETAAVVALSAVLYEYGDLGG